MKKIRLPYWPLALGPFILFAVGFLLNAVVLLKNVGQMPVQHPGGVAAVLAGDMVHVAMTAKSHLKLFADWIYIPGVGIASPGDLLELAGYYSGPYSLTAWATLMIKDRQ